MSGMHLQCEPCAGTCAVMTLAACEALLCVPHEARYVQTQKVNIEMLTDYLQRL